MKQPVFLHTFFYSKECTSHLVVIPSSCSVAKPPLEQYSDDVEKKRLFFWAQSKRVALILPYDDNIFCGKWRYDADGFEYTHSPKQRAAMIFEAICAKNKKGFKYNAVYLSDGMGSFSVVDELRRLTDKFGMLPKRAETLKVYGFDDAVHLQSYLGCLGVCTPVYYSRGLNALLEDVHQDTAGACALKPLNVAARAVQNLSGYILPEQVHPSFVVTKRHQTCFIVSELDRASDLTACLKWASGDSRQVAFILSQDTPLQTAEQFIGTIPPNIPVFSGVPVGHGECLNNGRPITLFAKAHLSVPDEIPVLSWENTADLKIAA